METLIGQTFDRLTVTARAGTSGNNATWLCSCSCGGTATVSTCNLRSGKTRSCGCRHRETCSIPMIGRTVASLLVIERAENGDRGRARWLCRCELCGTGKIVRGDQLRDGMTRCMSCRRPSWPQSLRFEDSAEAIKDHGSPKPHQPKPQGRPPAGSRVIVALAGEPRYVARLSEEELREVAKLNTSQSCKVARERKRRKVAEAARRPGGRPCRDPEREAERVAAWRDAGCPMPTPKPRPALPSPIGPALDRHPELPRLQRLALIAQHAAEGRGAITA